MFSLKCLLTFTFVIFGITFSASAQSSGATDPTTQSTNDRLPSIKEDAKTPKSRVQKSRFSQPHIQGPQINDKEEDRQAIDYFNGNSTLAPDMPDRP